ncbi:MAG: CPBP family intramembrane metalloprotease [Spirochaetia bacterium]|nr:CPBP family intramembrane metalloprotease [Spirochaetia bacterium]
MPQRPSVRLKDFVTIGASGLVFVFLLLWERTLRIFIIEALPLGIPSGPLIGERVSFALIFLGAGIPIFRALTRRLGTEAAMPQRSIILQVTAGLTLGTALFGGLLLYRALSAGADAVNPGSEVARGAASEFVLLLCITGCVTPILEESFYRYTMLGAFIRTGMPVVPALLVQAALFALVHPPGSMVVLFLVGLSLGILFWRAGLGGAILAHAVYNSGILVYTRFF